MPPDPPSSAGSVVALWRYPVKSMLGEELNATEITRRGLVGDRQFAVIDRVSGKIAGAKNPRKWGNFFDFRAAYTQTPQADSRPPEVRLTLPDGSEASSEQPDLAETLSRALGREVAFARIESDCSSKNEAEEYWPDIEGLEFRDTVTDFDLPDGTFFDLAVVHLLTTSTLDRLRTLYPEGRFEARRFRPNVVVSTPEQGFVENNWVGHTVAIGNEVRLQITGTCGRCVMTTLAQGDLPKDPGILRAAAQNNDANVGVYADVIVGGTIRRGDPVTVGS